MKGFAGPAIPVLVVDDEPSVLKLIRHTLPNEDYRVKTAQTPAAALEIIRSADPPAILITDIHIPEMSGLELMQAAREIHPDLLAIAITGYGDIKTAVAFMKAGGIDYLQKPVNRDVLRLSVAAAAERWMLRESLRRAGAALARSERRYRRIFDGAPVGIFQGTAKGDLREVNPTLAALFGYSDPEIMRKAGAIPFADPAEWEAAVSRAGEADGWITVQLRGSRDDGREIITRTTLRRIGDGTGRPGRIEGFVEDVTEAERRRDAFRWEMERARDLHALSASPGLPVWPDAAISVVCRPAERVGGDLLDIVRVDEQRLLIFLADVTGHGIPAAMTANTLKALFRERCETEADPAALCRHLNRVIQPSTLPDDLIAVFCARIDRDTKSLTYYLSGLPSPLIRRGNAVCPLSPTGLPLGVFETLAADTRTVAFGPGDRLIAVTDGITEAVAPDGSIFGGNRLHQAVKALSGRCLSAADEILAKAEAFRGGPAFSDDAIVLAIHQIDPADPPEGPIGNRFRGPDQCRYRMETRQVRIDELPATVMEEIRDRTGADPATFLDTLKLAVHEILTNAVEHGSLEMTAFKRDPDFYDSKRYRAVFAERMTQDPYHRRVIDVEITCRPEEVTVAVTDQGPGFDPEQVADPRLADNWNRPSGRGIAIARMNVDRLEYGPDGRRVVLTRRFDRHGGTDKIRGSAPEMRAE